METIYTDMHSGMDSVYSRTECLDSAGIYLAKGTVNPGHLFIQWSIKTDDGTFEAISADEMALTTIPGTTTAYDTYPEKRRIDMTAWENRRGPHGDYPSCTPFPMIFEGVE